MSVIRQDSLDEKGVDLVLSDDESQVTTARIDEATLRAANRARRKFDLIVLPTVTIFCE